MVLRSGPKGALCLAPDLGVKCFVRYGVGASASAGGSSLAENQQPSMQLHLFDHVVVRLSADDSPYRRPQPAMALVGDGPSRLSAPVSRAVSCVAVAEISRGSNEVALVVLPQSSLYDVIENLKEMSLVCLDEVTDTVSEVPDTVSVAHTRLDLT